MHEYDVLRSSIRKGLQLKNTTRTEGMYVPTSFTPIGGESSCLVCANDNYQIKLWKGQAEEAEKPYSCVRTTLSPTYGGPLNKIKVVPSIGEDGISTYDSQYLMYTTFNKVIGMVKMPLDGNPMKTSALIAHSGEITSSACTCDGKYVITAGGYDRSVCLWNVSTAALESSSIIGGDSNRAYLGLLEGGENGKAISDMKDYFYLCQLKDQGLNTTETRKITHKIPADQVI